MALTTYSELKTAISNHLNRTDLSSYVADFITLAEAKFKRDQRLRNVVAATISVSADGYALPARFFELVGLYHDGATHYGPLTMVNPDQLANHKQRTGDSGVPRYAAIVGSLGAETLRFAPEPDATYSLKLIYSAAIDPLSDTNTSNWLLEIAPDIYLYAALIEAEAFLQEDERIALWKGMLDEAIQRHYLNRQRAEFGGNLSRFPRKAIGGEV